MSYLSSVIVELNRSEVEATFAPGDRFFGDLKLGSFRLKPVKLGDDNTFSVLIYNDSDLTTAKIRMDSFNGSLFSDEILLEARCSTYLIVHENPLLPLEDFRLVDFRLEDFIDPDTGKLWIKFSCKPPGLEEQLNTMRKEGKFTDAVLISTEGAEVPVHRNVLAARSEVFHNMFLQEGFIEGKTGRAEVKLDASTLKELVSFIYTNKFDANNADVTELMMAGQYYNIVELRTECEAVLIKDFKVDTAAEVWMKAFMIEATELKKKATDFIAANFSQVKNTAGWAEIRRSEAAIADICQAFIGLNNVSQIQV